MTDKLNVSKYGGMRYQGTKGESELSRAGLMQQPTLYLGRCANTSEGRDVAGPSAAALVACFGSLALEAAGCCEGAGAWDCPAAAADAPAA